MKHPPRMFSLLPALLAATLSCVSVSAQDTVALSETLQHPLIMAFAQAWQTQDVDAIVALHHRAGDTDAAVRTLAKEVQSLLEQDYTFESAHLQPLAPAIIDVIMRGADIEGVPHRPNLTVSHMVSAILRKEDQQELFKGLAGELDGRMWFALSVPAATSHEHP